MPNMDQDINYRIGFMDEATGGIKNLDEEFTSAEEHMDEIVDSMGDMAASAEDSSLDYRNAVEGLSSIEPDLQDLPTLDQELKVELAPAEGEHEGVPQPEKAEPMDEKQIGFFEKIEDVFGNIGKMFKPLTKMVGAFAGFAVIARALSPVMEAMGYFLNLILEPFQDLFFNLMMQARPIISALLVKLYDFIDEVMPIMQQMMIDIVPKIIVMTRKIADFIFTAVIPAIKWLSELIQTFVKWKGFIPTIVGLIGGVLALVIGKVLVGAIIAVVTSLYGFAAAIVTTVIPAIFGAISAVVGFTIALLANPITWVVIGLVALVAILWKVVGGWEGVKNIFMKVWGGIKSFSSWLWGFFTTFLKWFSPIGLAMSLFGDSWTAIGDIVSMVWDKVVGFFSGTFDFVKELINMIPGIDLDIGAIEKSTEKITENMEPIATADESSGSRVSSAESSAADTGSVTYKGTVKIAPEKLGPVVSSRSRGKGKDGTAKLSLELRRLGDRVVSAIDYQRLTPAADISDRLRRLGSFSE